MIARDSVYSAVRRVFSATVCLILFVPNQPFDKIKQFIISYMIPVKWAHIYICVTTVLILCQGVSLGLDYEHS